MPHTQEEDKLRSIRVGGVCSDDESVTSRLYPIEDLDRWHHQKSPSRSLIQIRQDSLQDISKSSQRFLGTANAKKNVLSAKASNSEESIIAQAHDLEGLESMGRPSATSRWYLSVSIVIYGMIFNGSVFGYTSPALLTLQREHSSSQANHSLEAVDHAKELLERGFFDASFLVSRFEKSILHLSYHSQIL